ncbi:MAG: hypothetical protein WEB53_04245 [Akkermansiaceae bacterium]
MILRSLWLIALLLPTAAQEEKPAKPSTTGIQIKLLAEAAPADLGKVFMQLAEDEKSAAVDLPTRFLSNPILVPTRTMVLKTSEKEVPLCTINLPEAGKAFAIILVTAKPSGYTPIIVRTDDPTFKEGDVFFVNRSEKVVLGKLGKTPLILNPGETNKSRPTGAVDDAYYDIAFATRESQGDKLISSSRWPIDKNLRSYVFFFTSAQGKTSFRAVDEYMEVSPP